MENLTRKKRGTNGILYVSKALNNKLNVLQIVYLCSKFRIISKQKTNAMNIGLNVLFREPKSNRWVPGNAAKLMRYMAGKLFAYVWELGNEPVDLKGLDKHPSGNLLVCPDVSSPWNGDKRPVFLKEFHRNMKKLRSINAMTYHQYYTDNKASVPDFYSPEILDLLIKEIQKVKNIIAESGAVVSTWLGETSSSYDGSVPGVSDSFVAGFTWLDKLGVAARLGQKVVIKQSFYGGAYQSCEKAPGIRVPPVRKVHSENTA